VLSVDWSAGTLSDNGGTGCSIDLAAGTLTDTAATVCSIDLAAGTLTDTAGAGTTIDLVAGTLTDNGGTGVTIDIPAGTLTDNGGTGVSVDLLAGTLTDNAGAGLSLDLLSGTIKDTAVGTAINIDAAGTIDVSGQVTVGTLSDGTASITGGDLATVGAVGCDSVTATGAVEGLSVTDGTATMTTGALDGVTSLSSAQVKQPAVTETAGGAITSFPPGAVSLIDNSAGPVTIAFPTAPATGAIWHLGIKSDTSGANTVTLATDSSGGDLVSGMSGDVVICGARNYAGSSFSIFTDGAKYYCSRFGDASFGDVYGDAATFSAGVAVTGALTATTHTTVPQTFLEDSGAPTADDHNGTMAHRVIKATYDYSINGEGVGTHAIGLDAAGTRAEAIAIPAGSMIKKTYLYVETAFTSGGAATVAFQIAGANDVITQTAFDDGLFTVSTCAEGAQDGAPANMGVLAGTVSIVIGTAALTAGRVHLFIEYMTAT